MKQLPLDFRDPASPLEGHVWELIRDHEGKENAIAVPRLSELLDIDSVTLRRIVKDLIEIHCKPIGSFTGDPPGYFVITSEEERRKVRNSLVRRAVSILNRAKAFDRTGLVGRFAGQLELELDEKARR